MTSVKGVADDPPGEVRNLSHANLKANRINVGGAGPTGGNLTVELPPEKRRPRWSRR